MHLAARTSRRTVASFRYFRAALSHFQLERVTIERFQAALHESPERMALREIGETLALPRCRSFVPTCPLIIPFRGAAAGSRVSQACVPHARLPEGRKSAGLLWR